MAPFVCWASAGALTLLPYVGAAVGGRVVGKNMNWYNSLKHPSGTPPAWVFGPVWTILYGSMGVASVLALRGAAHRGEIMIPFAVYGSQLLLNWSWTPVFFGLHKLKASVAIILGTTVGAAASAYLFGHLDRTAGLLMVPYVLWLAYASSINIRTAILNKEAPKDE